MKNNIRKITVFLSILILFSCSTKNHNNNSHVKVIKVNPTSYLKQSKKIYRNISVIPLETNDKVIIGNIEKIEISKNLILILDNQSNTIFIFDSAGNYRNTIKSIGNGPKEYRVITDFSFNENEQVITVLDLGLLKTIDYHIDGSFLNQEPIKFYASRFQQINSGDYLYYSDNNTNIGNNISINDNIFICNKRGELINSFLPIKKDFGGFHMELGTPLTKYKTKININIPFNDTIYSFSQGAVYASWLIDFGKYKINDSYFSELKSNPRNSLRAIINSGSVFNVTNFFESKDHIIFQYMFNKKFYDVITFKRDLSSHIIQTDLNGLFTGIIGKPMYVNEDYFYSIVEPFEVIELMKNSKDSGKEFRKKLAFLTNNDNPLIIKYQFKDQF